MLTSNVHYVDKYIKMLTFHIVMLVHDDEEERTWEALEQLVEDVPVLVAKWVQEDGHHQLVATHRRTVRDAKKKKTRVK